MVLIDYFTTVLMHTYTEHFLVRIAEKHIINKSFNLIVNYRL